MSPAAWQGPGGENSIRRLFKALNASLRAELEAGLGRELQLSGRQRSPFLAPSSPPGSPSRCSRVQALRRQFPSRAHVPEGRIGAGGVPRNPHAPKAAAAQGSCVPRMLSWRGGLQGRAQERHCRQPELRCCAGAAQGAQGACSCRSPLSPGLAVFQGRVPEARGGWPMPPQGRGDGVRLPCAAAAGGPWRCRLGGGRFPGEGWLRSWLGNVGVPGQGGPGPARAAGGLFLLAGGFQQELRQQQPARRPHSQGSS